jgi:hypothetical protein
MGVAQWLSLLFPTFLKVLEALAADSPEEERAAMVDLEIQISRAKAARKLGPRPPP